jgi:hypothetical protein
MSIFSEAIAKIQVAYDDLGHELGWRFLSTPAKTLSESTQLVFLGLNPGGAHYEAPVISVEKGNAYHVERWGNGGELSGLQVQIQLLYDKLSERLYQQPTATLMDQTLAANFCPFRSPSWDRLHNRAKSVEFSKHLWFYLFQCLSPSVIICLTDLPFMHIGEVLLWRGFEEKGASKKLVGWGNVTYSTTTYEMENEKVTMIRLPHLSRYKVFGRHESQHAINELADSVVKALSVRNLRGFQSG